MRENLHDSLTRYLPKKQIWEFILKDKFALLFFALAFIFFLIKGILLIYPDLNLLYPYMAPDSYDWIANGLHYEGFSTNFSLRPPGLPLIIAFLDKLKLLPLLPLLNQLALFGILLFLYKIQKKIFGRPTALLLTFVLFFNFFLQNISLYILADLYAVLFIVLGYHFYQKAEEAEKNYAYAALFWSISFLFQHAVLFVLPAFLVHFFLFREKISQKTLMRAIAFFTIPTGIWFIYKQFTFTISYDAGIDYLELLRFHTDSIFFYLFNMVSLLGILPFLLLMVGWGGLAFAPNIKKSLKFLYLNILGFVFWVIFWVFLYDWNDRRFLIYALIFLAPFISMGIQTIFIRGYLKTNPVGKVFIIGLFLIALGSSSIPYESAFSLDTLKITNSVALKCESAMDMKTFKSSIDETSIQAERIKKNYSPLDLKNLYLAKKNVSYNEINNLKSLSASIQKSEKDELCIEYDSFTASQWYVDKNKYGNYFGRKTEYFPICPTPLIKVTAEGVFLDK